MNFRSSLPTPVRRIIRDSYVWTSSLTSSSRIVPDFLLVGGQRCGTTSLFRALEQHPNIVRPTFNKGINYFDLNYHRGTSWYRAHFPLLVTARRGIPPQEEVAAFEASGYYMFHPLAPKRIAADLPNIRIVAMLRDPVERAYSAWKHEKARGFDDLEFEEAIAREAERTSGERDRLIANPRDRSFAYRHFSYIARGDYASQLGLFYDLLPASNIHVVYSENFFANPEKEFSLLTDFLGVKRGTDITFEQHNARPSGPMPGQSRQLLNDTFGDQVHALERLVGRRPPWGGASGDVTAP